MDQIFPKKFFKMFGCLVVKGLYVEKDQFSLKQKIEKIKIEGITQKRKVFISDNVNRVFGTYGTWPEKIPKV